MAKAVFIFVQEKFLNPIIHLKNENLEELIFQSNFLNEH